MKYTYMGEEGRWGEEGGGVKNRAIAWGVFRPTTIRLLSQTGRSCGVLPQIMNGVKVYVQKLSPHIQNKERKLDKLWSAVGE